MGSVSITTRRPRSCQTVVSSSIVFFFLPLGAGLIRGVYVTVLVTTSRTWRTLGRALGLEMPSNTRPLWPLKVQSYGERMLRALNGDLRVEPGVARSAMLGEPGIVSCASRVGAEVG